MKSLEFAYEISWPLGIEAFWLEPIKFIYSEKATTFLTTAHTVKSQVKILQNFVAFSYNLC